MFGFTLREWEKIGPGRAILDFNHLSRAGVRSMIRFYFNLR